MNSRKIAIFELMIVIIGAFAGMEVGKYVSDTYFDTSYLAFLVIFLIIMFACLICWSCIKKRVGKW